MRTETIKSLAWKATVRRQFSWVARENCSQGHIKVRCRGKEKAKSAKREPSQRKRSIPVKGNSICKDLKLKAPFVF